MSDPLFVREIEFCGTKFRITQELLDDMVLPADFAQQEIIRAMAEDRASQVLCQIEERMLLGDVIAKENAVRRLLIV